MPAAAVDDANTPMYLHRAIIVSLALHAATWWWLSSGLYHSTAGAETADEPAPLSVSFLPAKPKITGPSPKAADTLSAPPKQNPSPPGLVESARPLALKPFIIPERAYWARIRGKLKLRLYIDRAGKVERVDILSAQPPGVYEQAAIEAATASTFLPARHNGIPVSSTKNIEIDVDPYETIGVR